jgi:hypothetical protein
MELKNIIIFVVIVVLIIIVIGYIKKDVSTLTNVVSGQSMQTIEASSLASSGTATSTSNFTYSIWFFIDDWNYRYGETKIIFGRMIMSQTPPVPCPTVVLGPLENNILVSLAIYPGADEIPSDAAEGVDDTAMEVCEASGATNCSSMNSDASISTCAIANVPIQRWCNLLVSVYGRTQDLYLDGKLVRTCVLPGVAKIDANAPVYVTPDGGFSGWTSKFQYWPDATDPQQAWNIYSRGYTNWLSSIFGPYQVQISLVENGNVQNSITI